MALLGVHGDGNAGGDEDKGSLDGMDARLDLAQQAEVQRHGDLRERGYREGEGSWRGDRRGGAKDELG
jgi:hypothetical protein